MSTNPKKTMSKTQKIIFVSLAVIVVILIIASIGGGKVQDDEMKNNWAGALTQPADSMLAGGLTLNYESNQVKADEQYKGKHLSIQGQVAAVEAGKVTLNAGKKRIVCNVNEDQADQLKGLSKGGTVTIDGVLAEWDATGGRMELCKIVPNWEM